MRNPIKQVVEVEAGAVGALLPHCLLAALVRVGVEGAVVEDLQEQLFAFE